MILKKIYVYSLISAEKLKEYSINKCGISIILGSKRKESTEGNGTGKTTFIECINTLLGKELPKVFRNSEALLSRDIFIVLEAESSGKEIFLGRRITDEENGYILIEKELSLELTLWDMVPNDEYRLKIQGYFYKNNEDFYPSFSQVREYLSRDEKNGFSDIILPRRTTLDSNRIIAFLSLFPHEYEKNIQVNKKRLKELNQKKKFINAIAGEIKELKIRKKKITTEIEKLQNICNNVDINKKITIDKGKYKEAKVELRNIQNRISKLEKVQEQYRINIENLKKKIKEIRKLNDVESFYNDLIQYFPTQIKNNYKQIKEFYDFMLENRGGFYTERIKELDETLDSLKSLKKEQIDIIEKSAKILQQDNIVDDINNIIEEINDKNLELAEINVKINYFSEKKEVDKDINKEKLVIIDKVNAAQSEFEKYCNNKDNLIKIFDKIVNETYEENGELDFDIEQNTDIKKNTGRIKFYCAIEDENSHGRSTMKINLFDITLFLNRVYSDGMLKLLIHDGSYCKPDDKFAKGRLIRYVEKKLVESARGQYIITANVDEFNDKDIQWMKDNEIIIANLNRDGNDKNRFFGFKY